MSDINNIGTYEIKILTNNNIRKKYKNNINSKNNKQEQKDKVEINSRDNSNNKNNSVSNNYNIKDGVKRPIKIDNSNNIIFVNFKGENKKIKIKPGRYTLTEISISIQERINESFGIGKVNLKITGSLSDGFIHAEEDKTNKFLIEK